MIRDGPVKSNYDTHVCHSRESGNPLFQTLTSSWIPAFAGMTTFYAANSHDEPEKVIKTCLCLQSGNAILC